MVAINPKINQAIAFEDYLTYHDGSDRPQELLDGTLVDMPPPTWMHMLIAKFLVQVLDQAIVESGRDDDWTTLAVPGQRTGELTSRLPDVAIVPFSTIDDVLASAVLTVPAPLVIEIVSQNWQDDYLIKLAEYETLGIPEYWIVDYQGLGGTRYIGRPKQPTISIYTLVDGEYQVSLFRLGKALESAIFPELVLSADAVFSAGQPRYLRSQS
ncbi:MAG: Uma2 family endonuclease [Tildeniella torsiva UHER 1998/13D]|jgi:Uma2 family endonuclease|nr:Uma2 family endonuclease [Tildeniella torsiva UHER 1998/13D]